MEYMFLPLKRYTEFSGRSRRMEYWMFFLFQFIVGVVFQAVMMTVGGVAGMSGGATSMLAMGGTVGILLILYLLFALAMLIPNIAVSVRRLHDTDRTGWWLLAPIVPYVLVVVFFGMAAAGRSASAAMLSGLFVLVALGLGITLLVFFFLDGTKGPNKYGPDPKGRADAAVFA